MSGSGSSINPKGQELTGKRVLLYFVGFFVVVAAVNAVMVHVAVKTFAGTETGSSYKAGLAYNKEEAAARAQDALNWQVDGQIARAPSGDAILTVAIKDRTQKPIPGIKVAAQLAHPLNARLDHSIELIRMADGTFRGTTDASAGQWTLLIDVTRDGERIYRTKSRVVLK